MSCFSPIGDRGFTVVELLATISIISILVAIAMPKFSEVQSQMNVSNDTRQLAYSLGQLRSQANRLHTPVRITFSSDGYSWDIGDDSSSDGSVEFHEHSAWDSSTPSDLVFNGLGLVPSIATTRTLTLENNGLKLNLRINSNGYIEIL